MTGFARAVWAVKAPRKGNCIERRRTEQPRVGRDEVATLQLKNVAGDNFRRGNGIELSVAADARARRGHLLQRGNRFFRVELLVETDDGIENDDGEDGDTIHDFAKHAGDEGGFKQLLDRSADSLVRADSI